MIEWSPLWNAKTLNGAKFAKIQVPELAQSVRNMSEAQAKKILEELIWQLDVMDGQGLMSKNGWRDRLGFQATTRWENV